MNYQELKKRLFKLDKKYKVSVIGKTCRNRKIYAVEKINGKGFFTAIFVASIHAREWITTDLMFELLEQNLFDDIKDFNICLVPMANPDGVELCHSGTENFLPLVAKKLRKINGGNEDFSLWKANARGVDLNNNYSAEFKKHNPLTKPASQGYAGRKAESEKETKAIKKLLKKVNPFIVLCYHTKGEEIYFQFHQTGKTLERDKKIAEKIAQSTGYAIKNVENSSSGGLKDYVVQSLHLPSVTIECGNDRLNHPITQVEQIFLRNKNIANDLIFAYNEFMLERGNS